MKLRKPRIRIGKKGLGIQNLGVRAGGRKAGVNLSRRGVSAGGSVGGVSYNSKRGCILPFWLLGVGLVIEAGVVLYLYPLFF